MILCGFKMDKLLNEALKSLNIRVNVSTGLVHPSDMSTAKEMFKLLRKEEIELDSTEISRWAVNNGWKTDHAVELGELASRIGSGGIVQVSHKGRWPEDILKKWKERAEDSK